MLAELEKQLVRSQQLVVAQGEAAYLSTLSSCTAAAANELYDADARPSDSKEGAQLVTLSAKAQEQVGVDERVAAMNKDWVRCMTNAGFGFQTMSDGRAQFQFAPEDTTEPTGNKVRTAVADATCRQQFGVDALIATLYSEALTKLLESAPDLATDLQTQLRSATSRAEAILKTT